MSKPDIYQQLDEQHGDIVILQIALALLIEKLRPVVKIERAFWDEVHEVYEKRFKPEPAAETAPEPQAATIGGENE